MDPTSPVHHPRDAPPARKPARGSVAYALSVVALVAASSFTGAMVRPLLDRWRHPVPSAGELALFLEHATVDVRLGRAAPLAEQLGSIAARVSDPAVRERVLALWAEAALQARRPGDAATAEEQREALVDDPDARSAIRLRRVGLAASSGRPSVAEELAKPLLAGSDPRLADEARLRLASGMSEGGLRSWIASDRSREPEEARRAGLAALRLLGDAAAAEALLAPLGRAGPCDASLCSALLETYGKLERPRDVARVARVLADQARTEEERARLVLLEADALARSGETAAALAALDPLRRSQTFDVRLAARRARYDALQRAGRLRAEVANISDPAERAFVALEVERDPPRAVLLYRAASAALPDSLELAEGLREAERRLELAERRALYLRVLEKEPGDGATRDKLLGVLVALGEEDAARAEVARTIRGREGAPEPLVAAAISLRRAGLGRDAAAYLERAYAAATDLATKQQILFSLGDLYEGAREVENARRLYGTLAEEGASAEIRDRAVARLASLLR